MDFALSKKHEMARTLFKEFAETEVKPLAQEVDETEVFPAGTVEKMAKAGFTLWEFLFPRNTADRAAIPLHIPCA